MGSQADCTAEFTMFTGGINVGRVGVQAIRLILPGGSIALKSTQIDKLGVKKVAKNENNQGNCWDKKDIHGFSLVEAVRSAYTVFKGNFYQVYQSYNLLVETCVNL
jgi:hypothetical protein